MARNYAGILTARIFVGLPEVCAYIYALRMAVLILSQAAFYPGAVYLLSRWYTRKAGLQAYIWSLLTYNDFLSLGTSVQICHPLWRATDLKRIWQCTLICYYSYVDSSLYCPSLWLQVSCLGWRVCSVSEHGDGKFCAHNLGRC